MLILGISLNFHDSGAALVENGRIVAAVNEERFSRIKMDGSVPYQSIAYVLSSANVTEKDIDIIVFSDMSFGISRHLWFIRQQLERVWYSRFKYLKSFLKPSTFDLGRLLKQVGFVGLCQSIRTEHGTKEIISRFQKKGFVGKVKFVSHDRSHAAGAYYTSGMSDAFICIIEGSSFKNTCSFWKGEGNTLTKVDEVSLPHSPGRYYEIVTLILGFHPNRHGGKITGLAALGDHKICYKNVSDLLYMKNGKIHVGRELYALHDEYFALGKQIPKRFQKYSREDIAAAFQKRLEDVIIEQIVYFSKKYSIENIALSGGVVANVKLNMEIGRIPGVKQAFVYPGMSDIGQALGVALSIQADYDSEFKPFVLKDVYLGPYFSDFEIESVLKKNNISYKKSNNVGKDIGALLARDNVVACFQGRMEYGPRSLGNRSILYPATDSTVNDWLNKKLNRTEFMPFAPVTLSEDADKCYLELEKFKLAAQFMTVTLPVTSYMKEKMPAAVHVDDTARPQIIDRETNPVYYDALKEYKRLTGYPSIINTSFNMHEEPIVCTPTEALKAFKESGLDSLAIGNYIVLK